MAENPAPRLVVVSINTLGVPFWRTGFSSRYRTLARRIAGLQTDVVFCQEVFTWWHLRLLRRGLPGFPYVSVSRSVIGPAAGLAMFSKAPLERTDYQRFDSPSRDAMKGLPLRTRLTLSRHGILSAVHRATGVRLVNTHASANSYGDWSVNNPYAGVHRAQLTQLAKATRVPSFLPTVVAGDFNTAADSSFYREFRSQTDLTDVFDDDPRPTFRPEFLPTGRKAHRIDFIFGSLSSLRVVHRELVFDTEPAVSDHLGLTATFELSPSVSENG